MDTPLNTALVELVGPAGVGKTTLTRALLADGGHLGIELPRVVYLTTLLTSTLQLFPTYALRPGPGRWLNRAELRSVAYLNAWHARAGSERGLTVFDQGPVYRLAFLKEFGPGFTRSGAFTAWWETSLERWARSLHLVVWLDAPDEVLLERINGRAQAHLVKGALEREARLFLTRYRAAFGAVIGAMDALGGPEVIRLDTSRLTPEQAAAAVAGRLAVRGDRVRGDRVG